MSYLLTLQKGLDTTMNLDKLNNFTLTGKIHTVEVISRFIDTEQYQTLRGFKGVTYCQQTIDYETGELITKFRFNPEIYNGEKVNSLELFHKLLYRLMCDIGVGNNYLITRLDFALDNYKSKFDEFAKLNRYMLSLLSISKDMQNRYESNDFLKLTNLNIKVVNKSKSFEVEAYNKQIEVERQGRETDIKSRLEFRKSQLDKNHYKTDVFSETVNEWLLDLHKSVAADTIHLLEDMVNEALVEHYKSTQSQYGGKRAVSGSIRNINLFIQSMQQYIYSKKQLIKLYELLEVPEPRKHADNYKRNYRVEFFSMKDAKRYVETIRNAVDQYKDNIDYTEI